MTDSGFEFSYTSVYGRDDEFVFHMKGSFESTNGLPANHLTITYNANFSVYGLITLTDTEDLFDTFDTEYNDDEEITGFSYNLTGYDNFRIVNDLLDGDEDNVLGIMTFWS